MNDDLWCLTVGRSRSQTRHDNNLLSINILMFKQFISKIPGADIYMVGSFVTFLVFFSLVGLYLLLVDKSYIRQMSQMPLDDSSTD